MCFLKMGTTKALPNYVFLLISIQISDVYCSSWLKVHCMLSVYVEHFLVS